MNTDVTQVQEGPERSKYSESLRLHRPMRERLVALSDDGLKVGAEVALPPRGVGMGGYVDSRTHKIIHVEGNVFVVRTSGYTDKDFYYGPQLSVGKRDEVSGFAVYAEIEYDRETRKMAEARAKEIAANIEAFVEACETSQREAEAQKKAEQEKAAAERRDRLEAEAKLINADELLEALGPRWFEPGDVRAVKRIIESMVEENRKKLGLED